MKIALFGNDSPENGGCEAITKGTIEILQKTFGKETTIYDCHFNYSSQTNVKKIGDTTLFPVQFPKRFSGKWFLFQLYRTLFPRLLEQLLYASHQAIFEECDIVLSLGGDNYSLDYGIPERFIALGHYAKRHHCLFAIWGASIGPFTDNPTFEQRIAKHLKQKVDLILLREEESAKYLATIGVEQNVEIAADPAFAMIPEPIDYPLPQTYVCLNFSVLMANYVCQGNVEQWSTICRSIIRYVDRKGFDMVFVPHVKTDHNYITELLAPLTITHQAILLPKEMNAANFKYIISKSLFNIACRTHSTIASFSTAVPTFCLGYSIKSLGLSDAMYGNRDFVLYQTEIQYDLFVERFEPFLANLTRIKDQLSISRDKQREKAFQAGKTLNRLTSC